MSPEEQTPKVADEDLEDLEPTDSEAGEVKGGKYNFAANKKI